MEKFSRWMLRHPKAVILLYTVLTIFLTLEIRHLTIDPAIDDFLPDNHPEVVFFDEMREVFGLLNFVIVGVVDQREGGVFRPDTLTLVKDLSLALEDIPNVIKVMSLYEFPYIEGNEEGMEVIELLTEEGAEQQGEQLRERIFRWPLLVGSLVSEDGKATTVLVRYERDSTEALRRRIYHSVVETVGRFQTPHQEIFTAGMTAIETCIADSVARDMKTLLPAVFAVIIVCLWLSFRRPIGVILPLLTVILSILWTMGVMALVRVPLNTLTSTVPVLLTAVGTAYTIHILFHFLHNAALTTNRQEALVQSVSQVGYAVIMAGLTTCGGFASLAVTEVVPIRYFGIFAAVGTLVSLITSLTLVPAILTLAMNRIRIEEASSRKDADSRLGRALRAYVGFVTRRRRVFYAASLVLAVLFVAGTFRIYAESDYITQFKRSSYVRQSDEMINRYFNGSSVLDIIVMGDEPGLIKDPDVLRKMEALQRFAETQPHVGGTTSLVDYLKRMNQALHADDPAQHRVPDTREMVAQCLLLYTMSGDESDLEEMINHDYSMGTIVIMLKSGSTRYADELVEKIKAFNEEKTRLPIHMTASMVIGKVVDDLTVTGQTESMFTSIGVVFFLVVLILQSFVGGFLAILPLLLCLLCNFGIMGWTGVPLQTGTAIIASVALGIGIDYAIHFLNITIIKARQGMDVQEALQEAGGTAGRAIAYNATAVGFGFSVLVFSSFIWNVYFGAFITLTMVTASFATITYLPCLICTFLPKFLHRRR